MFQEPTKNVPMAASAIILLVIGVYAVSTSQAKDDTNFEVEVVADVGVGVRVVVEVSHKEVNDVSKYNVDNRGENEECQEDYIIFENPMLAKEINGDKDINNLQKENKSDKIIVTSDSNYLNSNHLSFEYKIKADIQSTDLQDGRKEATVDPITESRCLSLNIEEIVSRDPKFHDSILSIENESENENENKNINEIEICQQNKKLSFTSAEYFNKLKFSFGAYFLCFSVGLCDGTLLVPFKLGNTNNNSILHVFRYLASFGISSIMVSPFMFLLYTLILNGRRIPSFHFQVAALPGISSGVLWASANFLSVHATFYLGKKFVE